jgi:hypothetical protein
MRSGIISGSERLVDGVQSLQWGGGLIPQFKLKSTFHLA